MPATHLPASPRRLLGRLSGLSVVFLTCALALAACGGGGSGNVTPPDDDDDNGGTGVNIPSRGDAATFDAATWNIEWFGDRGNGPEDEDAQQRYVRDVINGAEIDLWAVQEIVSPAAFSALVSAAPGYSGLLANQPSVDDGPAYYNDFGGNEQKVGLIYRSEAVEVLSARIILTELDFEFAGRPPMEVRVRVTAGGTTVEGVVVVLHAKASRDSESYQRRQRASEGLQNYLDAAWPNTPVWVLGDFNDDVDTSITFGRPSPYAGFVAAPDWSFTTGVLSAAGASSTVGFSDVIDHHLVSDEAAAGYVDGSAEVFRVDRYIQGYANSTSDHYPVLARYRLDGGAPVP